MFRAPALITIVLFVISPPANAFTKTAAEMLETCKQGLIQETACSAFVSGVIYGFVDASEHIRLTTQLEHVPKLFCITKDWTAGIGLQTLIVWAGENPELLKYSPSAAVLWAHREAYPCE